ncbi:hypothetical protein LINGRAHAP2_LOCUS3574 [Linum grandiflorum]
MDDTTKTAAAVGSNIGGDGSIAAPRRPELRDHPNPPQCCHRRSRSASEKNVQVRRMSQNEMQMSSTTWASPRAWTRRRSYMARSPLRNQHSAVGQNDLGLPSNHRASLEQDVELLQLRLQEERSMRLMLERAMGRASSTLSPGHRHFTSQTKELIDEIELLEQEVTNREQHVLSLYRTIFDQCVPSKPVSEQSSSSNVASPSHHNHQPKPLSLNKKQQHPRIISTAFCSSKMFPLRSLQSLATDSGGRRGSSRGGGPTSLNKSCSTQIEHKSCTTTSEPMPSTMAAQKTLKDHLHRRRCPSKLSEEMVKCMAAVYCWLCSTSTSSAAREKKLGRSPLLSRSSTNVVLPRRGTGGGGENSDYWSCKSTVEVCWISNDQSRCSSASYAIDHYRVLVEQLEAVTVTQMETNAQIAFWINVYNSLVMHAYLAYGIPHSSLRRLALFHKCRPLTT